MILCIAFSGSSANIGLILGISLGVGVVLTILAGIPWCYKKFTSKLRMHLIYKGCHYEVFEVGKYIRRRLSCYTPSRIPTY